MGAQFPYNPDSDADQIIGSEDLLYFLPLYGESFIPNPITAHSVLFSPDAYDYEGTDYSVGGRLDALSYALLYGGNFTGTITGKDFSYRNFTRGGANATFVNCDLTGTVFKYGGFYGTTFEDCYFTNGNGPEFKCVKAIDSAIANSDNCYLGGSAYYQTDCFTTPWYGDWYPSYNVTHECIEGINGIDEE